MATLRKHSCFVICPFGDPSGSETDKALFQERLGLRKHIFKEAAKICRRKGFDVQIADGEELNTASLSEAETRTETAKRIDQSDVVIVVATANHKPNTWIELGWSHGFWRSPIVLVRKGFTLPSDVVDKIYLPYTEAMTRGEDATGAHKLAGDLAGHIIHKLSFHDRVKPFEHLDDSALAVGKVRFYNRFSRAFSFADLMSIMQEADDHVIIASPRMYEMVSRRYEWRSRDGIERANTFANFLLECALVHKVKVTLLFQHPDNYDETHRRRDAETTEPIEKIREQLLESFEYWCISGVTAYRNARRNAEEQGETYPMPIEEGFRIVRMRRRYLPYRVTRTEKRAVTTLRFFTEAVNSGLCIDAKPLPSADQFNKSFYHQICEEIDFLIAENVGDSEPDYQDFLRRKKRG